MTDTSHDIRVLNGLIATTIDSIDGYEESAKEVESGLFAEKFEARANERRQIVGQLRREVERLGGKPEDDGTLLAGAQRAFFNFKLTVTDLDDQAVIAEVERSEDHIKSKFSEALADETLSPETRSTIESAFQSIVSGHEQMSALKHGVTSEGTTA